MEYIEDLPKIDLDYAPETNSYRTKCLICGGTMTLNKPDIQYPHFIDWICEYEITHDLKNAIFSKPVTTLTNLYCKTCEAYIPTMTYTGDISISIPVEGQHKEPTSFDPLV
jgi:hypothetical protein